MWRDAALVAGKDLRIEMRSRVLVNQVAPFGVIVLVLFAFALGPDAQDLLRAAPGVFWVAVLFAGLLAIQRAFAIESSDGARDGLRLGGPRPGRGVPRQGGCGLRPARRPRAAARSRSHPAVRRSRPRRVVARRCLRGRHRGPRGFRRALRCVWPRG